MVDSSCQQLIDEMEVNTVAKKDKKDKKGSKKADKKSKKAKK